MRLFAAAIRGMTNAVPVEFAAAPYFDNDPNHKKIYAWIFSDNNDVANATTRNAIILNLDEIEQYVDLNVFNVNDGQFEQLFNYNPAVFSGGSAVYSSTPTDPVFIQGFPTIHTTKNNLLSSQKISSNNPTNFKLFPFSITDLHYSVNSPAVTPSSATVCSGNSITLKATGGCSYECTVNPSTYTLDESTGNIISVHPETTGTYTFTVTVKNKNGNPVPGSPQTAIVTVAATPTPFIVSTVPNGCDVVLTASQSANTYTWFPSDGLSATTGQSVTAAFSTEPRTYIVTASNGSCQYVQPLTASQIINTGNQLAIEHLNRAYVANCDNELYFHNDENDETAIFGMPIGGYIEIEKWDINGNMVGTDLIDAGELSYGISIPCDVIGKYMLRYKYAAPACSLEYVLEQTTFMLGVEATATFNEVCPEFSLLISPTDKSSWEAFYWEPANSYLYDENGVQIQSNTSYQQVYFKNSASGTYPVTLKGLDGNTECSSFNYVVKVSDQCCSTGDNAYVNLSVSQLFDHLGKKKISCGTTYNGSTDFSNTLYLNGTLTVDQNAAFINTQATDLNLVFGKDANVLLDDYRTLNWDDVHAYACNTNAWRGIEVFGTQSELSINNSKVEETYRSVHATENTTITLSGSAFEDNYTSVYFNASGIGADFSSSIMHSCSFKTVDGLKFYAGQSQMGDLAKYGITLANVGKLAIGSDVSGEENVFDNLRCGINGSRSSFDITRCSFTNMIRPATFTNSDGCGVFESVTTTNSTLTVNVSGMGQNAATPNFQNCVNGIWLKGVRSDGITDNYMKDVTNGIMFTACNNASMLSITYNRIVNTNLGISVSTSNNATANILFNDITTNVGQPPAIPPPPVVTAISISDNSQALACHVTISSNTLDLKGHYGIYVSNNSSAVIENNTINHNTGLNLGSYAFRLDNSNLPLIRCNTVVGIGNVTSALNNKKSFSFSMTTNATLKQNSTDGNRTAFEFVSSCAPTTFIANEIKYHRYGVQLGISGVTATMGNQLALDYDGNPGNENPGNLFKGQNNNGSFPNGYALAGNSSSDLTQFAYNLAQPYPPLSIQNPPWSPLTNSLINYSPAPCSQAPAMMQSSSSSEEENIATKESESENVIDVVIDWNEKKELVDRLTVDTSLLESSETLQTFYDTIQQNNIAEFSKVDSLISGAKDDTLSEASLLEQAAEKNSLLISAQQFEENLKLINGIIIAQLQQQTDSLSETDKSVIEDIASQCPFTGGYAVYQARAIREVYAGSTFYDEEQLCFSNQKKSEESESLNIGVQVYPNPASDDVFILLSGVIQEKEVVNVMDIYGALRWQYYLHADENLVQCKLNDLPSGIYCVAYSLSDGSKVCSSTFTIAK